MVQGRQGIRRAGHVTRVTCAIIFRNGEILAARRGEGMDQAGLWEFPGGKVMDGEGDEACLVREIREELSLEVQPIRRLGENAHTVEGGLQILLIPFLCELTGGSLEPSEHSECRWCDAQSLTDLNWCPADMPIVEQALHVIGAH